MVAPTSMDGYVSLGEKGRDLLAAFGEKPNQPPNVWKPEGAWDEV